ncbi:SNF2 domain-containing protein CLASSY 3 [Morella rubra]|uniref:SNF2 domain-containing protein CLASSY 3 n=1 Tax=Morella rubra TaxID=262757 RepID=A0A6A1VJJ6_9ROSI|nr:SNF2 domain-containing protein CLASSY 3 [Morella rubra]
MGTSISLLLWGTGEEFFVCQPLCNSEVETEEHLAFQCLFVKIIWGDLLISGVLEDWTKLVLVVKVLKRVDQQGGREFLLAEVEMISRGLHHPNLVKLIGMRISTYVLRSALLHLVYELIPTSGTFSASDIEKVTDNFYASRVLGEGGFGLVYSGVLGDGTKVAIKIVERDVIFPFSKLLFPSKEHATRSNNDWPACRIQFQLQATFYPGNDVPHWLQHVNKWITVKMQIPCGILRQIINGGLDDLCQDSICDLHIDCDLLVNMLEPVWDIIPGVKSSLCPHQRYGFEFLWKNIAGGIYLDRLKNQTSFSGGSVCIVLRAPGPIVVAPCSMLLTWEEEFRKWKYDIPFHNLKNQVLLARKVG